MLVANVRFNKHRRIKTLRLITSRNASPRRVDNTYTYCVPRVALSSTYKGLKRLNEGGLNRASRFPRYDSFKKVLALRFLRVASGSIKLATSAKSSPLSYHRSREKYPRRYIRSKRKNVCYFSTIYSIFSKIHSPVAKMAKKIGRSEYFWHPPENIFNSGRIIRDHFS